MASSSPAVAEGAVSLPKDAAFGAGATVRRPGRLRVMHPHVAEFLRSPRRHARPASSTATEKVPAPAAGAARYECAFEADEAVGDVAAPGRLVWGKVRHHPWWPGQVFHAADASGAALALRRPRRAALVAFFWDKTFAWNTEAALRPFRADFPRLANHARGGTAAFAAAVDAALAEVARRVGAGLTCCCCNDAANAGRQRQVVDNAGVREGAYGAPVDAAFARAALRGEDLVGYVAALAAAPLAGAHRVDVAVAAAQVEALGRWRGAARGLPEYAVVHGIGGDAATGAAGTAKRRRSSTGGGDGGGGKRRVSRSGAGREEEKGNEACDGGDYDALELEDFPPPAPQQMSTKIGKLMSRAAQQMSLSPVILRGGSANGSAPPPAMPRPHMARCAGAGGDKLLPPPVNNGGHVREALYSAVMDKWRPAAGKEKEGRAHAGLVLNFSSAGVVPSANHLTTIFSRFGPVREVVRAENSTVTVVFEEGVHASEVFAGTAKISSISAYLDSFRITHLPPVAAPPVDAPPSTLLDPLLLSDPVISPVQVAGDHLTPAAEAARYECAFEDDEDGAHGSVAGPGRLVWGKVRHHPWWPGQVFHAAGAALARRRPRGALLLAFFGDRTFAWNAEAALRPFRADFPRLANHARGGTAAFAAAVDAALAEVARRVGAGLTCCCCNDDANAGMQRQAIDKAGVREGAYGAPVDAAFARASLRGEALVGYVAALAAAPLAGAHRVDLAVAAAQIEAFGRWRGAARGLPEYAVVHGIGGDAVAGTGRAKRRRTSTGGRGGGGGKRRVSRSGAEGGEEKGNAACDGGDYEALELEDFPPPAPQQMSTKIGKLMSRAAQQMSLSPVILRGANGNSNGNDPSPAMPQPHMARCAGAGGDELPPPVNNGDHARGALYSAVVDKWRPAAGKEKEDRAHAGLVLNFSSAGVVPSASHLTTIFNRFGPVREVRAKNSTVTVVFERGVHANAAFSGTAKISSISASLISFRITHLPPAAAPVDPPRSTLLDPLPAEPLQRELDKVPAGIDTWQFIIYVAITLLSSKMHASKHFEGLEGQNLQVVQLNQ
ncbi:hypothetical protein U9M48_041712 [Paspalum notatum var. saurae]|uniref:PWWP domain-containing protein n=1 Tax=Paspalum notatum var. saurae TaxID=547442 RepID=A0AAQ3UR60_PASNO